jgi:hypothetical protein
VFLQNSEIPMIFRTYGIIFLKKNPYNMSTAPWTGFTGAGSRVYGLHLTPALASGSTAQIKPIELVSQLLISAVHRRYDGRDGWLRPGVAPTCARGRASRLSMVAHWSLSFLKPRWSVFDDVCSYGITVTSGTCLC